MVREYLIANGASIASIMSNPNKGYNDAAHPLLATVQTLATEQSSETAERIQGKRRGSAQSQKYLSVF